MIGTTPVIKSEQDFEYMTLINVYAKGGIAEPTYKCPRFDFVVKLTKVPIASPEDVDKELQDYVNTAAEVYKQSDKVLGYTDVEINVQEHDVRTGETNMGNFLADLANLYNETDVCILNSGSIRYDNIVAPGEIRLSVFKVNYSSDLIIKEVTGEILLAILERSVSTLPEEAGSFLQVSGIEMTYDLEKPVRVQSVKVNGHDLNPKKTYTLTCSDYLGDGGDGYTMLKECKTLLDGASSIDQMDLIIKFFRVYDLKIKKGNVKEIMKRG